MDSFEIHSKLLTKKCFFVLLTLFQEQVGADSLAVGILKMSAGLLAFGTKDIMI